LPPGSCEQRTTLPQRLPPDRRRIQHDSAAEAQRALLTTLRETVERADAEHALQGALQGLAALARSPSPAADGLFGANPQAQDTRAEILDELARLIERMQSSLPGGARTPDLPPRVVLGGALRVLARSRRGGDGEFGGLDLSAELADWIGRYERPRAEHLRHSLRPRALPALKPTSPLLTMSLIVPEGVAGEREACFHQTLGMTAGAYFRAGDWPARIWHATRTAAHFIDDEGLAYANFVQAPAEGEAAAAHTENSALAFTLFLQEGYRCASPSISPPSRVALEAIAASVFEIGYLNARGGHRTPLSGFVADVTYLALAPFLGPAAAEREIEALVRETLEGAA
jgi:hypothetical protein